jgi:hypothetical protein
MAFPEDDDVIQTLATDAAKKAFTNGVHRRSVDRGSEHASAGLGSELVRWTLIVAAYLAHPLGVLVCFRLPGGWRRHKLALALKLLETFALPATLAAGLVSLAVLLRYLPLFA